ncbi:MAG TPA: 5-(carboxyamino)imidazole ribonucleotide synthase [Rhodospirillaceae bacterium]|nr:5-(carboxyamino)imidazole ribonucleotide synthase [Rhodospirillaceae bacterium]
MRTLTAGSVIGILGGGQLARMTAMAAARLGFSCHVYCPDETEPAVAVCAQHTQGAFDNEEALERFAKAVDVVTLEWENVPLAALDVIAQHTVVFPSASVLRIAQDRGLEKRFAREIGVGTADFAIVKSADELATALAQFSRPVILKSTRMGYDGKGQVKISEEMDAATAWKQMGSDEGIVEAFVPFEKEVSVIVARREDGAIAAFPVVENIHRNHILAETHAPALIDPAVAKEATDIAMRMATHLHVVGLLAVELFVLKEPNAKGQSVLMNEIAPRPHNSGHWTIDACSCSQFEMLVRVIAGLPLGNAEPHSKALMLNILGEDLGKCFGYVADTSACLHLYGKKEPRDGRKMGHVTFLKGAW